MKARTNRPAILVVEDDVVQSLDLQDRLENLGYRVMGAAGNVARAHALLDEQLPDAATLDVNLKGEASISIARRLASDSIPCVLVTANAPGDITAPALRNLPQVQKPVQEFELKTALERLVA